jgi:hypothetical protein
MIKTTEDIIYNRIKNTIGFEKAQWYLELVGSLFPGKVLHHLFGSYSQNMKTTDFTVLPIAHEVHDNIAEKNKSEFAINNITELIKTLIQVIKHQRETIQKLKRSNQ